MLANELIAINQYFLHLQQVVDLLLGERVLLRAGRLVGHALLEELLGLRDELVELRLVEEQWNEGDDVSGPVAG